MTRGERLTDVQRRLVARLPAKIVETKPALDTSTPKKRPTWRPG